MSRALALAVLLALAAGGASAADTTTAAKCRDASGHFTACKAAPKAALNCKAGNKVCGGACIPAANACHK